MQQNAVNKEAVSTSGAPKPIGPYSQAIISKGFVFTAGQGAIDPITNKWIGGDIKQQTKLTLDNISAILKQAGSSLDKVLKTTVFLRKKELFGEMNEVYQSYFSGIPPARSTVVTDLLRDDMLVEIETVATL